MKVLLCDRDRSLTDTALWPSSRAGLRSPKYSVTVFGQSDDSDLRVTVDEVRERQTRLLRCALDRLTVPERLLFYAIALCARQDHSFT